MTEEQPKWFEKPLVGRYSVLDFARTGLAVIFIMVCMSALTLYLHYAVEKARQESVTTVEYVNMQQEDITDGFGTLIAKAPDLVIDRIIEFPMSYNKLDMHGYILVDSTTNMRYLYLRTGDNKAIAITKYWTKRESEIFGSLMEHLSSQQEHNEKFHDEIHEDSVEHPVIDDSVTIGKPVDEFTPLDKVDALIEPQGYTVIDKVEEPEEVFNNVQPGNDDMLKE